MSMMKRYLEDKAEELAKRYIIGEETAMDILIETGDVRKAEEYCRKYVEKTRES